MLNERRKVPVVVWNCVGHRISFQFEIQFGAKWTAEGGKKMGEGRKGIERAVRDVESEVKNGRDGKE